MADKYRTRVQKLNTVLNRHDKVRPIDLHDVAKKEVDQQSLDAKIVSATEHFQVSLSFFPIGVRMKFVPIPSGIINLYRGNKFRRIEFN